MRYYIPASESAPATSSDAFAFTYMARACPSAIDFNRCPDTGALLIDFIDGSTLEISNGEREAHSGTFLHHTYNAKAWLKALRHERNRRIIDAVVARQQAAMAA